MNNDPNAEVLSLSNNKNDWFGLCYELLDKDFDNKVYFENNNIKTFQHAFLYHCGYRDKDALIQKIQKIKTKKEQNQTQKQSTNFEKNQTQNQSTFKN